MTILFRTAKVGLTVIPKFMALLYSYDRHPWRVSSSLSLFKCYYHPLMYSIPSIIPDVLNNDWQSAVAETYGELAKAPRRVVWMDNGVRDLVSY